MPSGPGIGTLFGVASAVSFGVGDFAGGLAARRAGGLAVAAVAQLIGGLVLLVIAAVTRPALPDVGSLTLGVGAGLAGAIGVAALYRGLALGAMGLIASISGVGTVAIPLLFSIYLAGSPIRPLQVVGVGLAAAAIVAAGGASRGAASRQALVLALLAAVGFGFWSVLLDQAAHGSGSWALVTSRVAGTTLLLTIATLRGSLGPVRHAWPLVTVSGACDVGGNALFVVARGSLPVGLAAALVGIYPVITLLLARVIVRERLPVLGIAGVGLALLAIVLISAG
ncbi:MAG TPA: EamA family transporter [Candidatus Limnocylindria bacterium]|nr:EamA family transporter [Candidatus Limnocylindria bacterium]